MMTDRRGTIHEAAAPDQKTEEHMPYARLVPTYDNHKRRATEADGTVHAARGAAGGAGGFTTACVVYPAPRVKRLEFAPEAPVTCNACLRALGGAA